MAAHVFSAGLLTTFPEGVTVTAHVPEARRAGAAPSGPVLASATWQHFEDPPGWELAFPLAEDDDARTGLRPGVPYVAYAAVGGRHRYVAFTAKPRAWARARTG